VRLYELPEAIRDAMARAVDPETGEINEALESELGALQEAFEQKAEYIALLAREARAEAAAVKQEEDRLAKRRKSAEGRERRLKDYLLHCMSELELTRIEGSRAKIRIQANPPSVSWVGDDGAIPEEYRVVSVRANLALARDQYKAGDRLPEGFAVEIGNHVRIT
jgi:hypothetical protein